MSSFLWPSHRDVPVIGDASAAALLAGAELPAGSPPELRALASALAELRGLPAGDELAGEAGTLAAFRSHFGAPGAAHRAPPARPQPGRPQPTRPQPARPQLARPQPTRPLPTRPQPAKPSPLSRRLPVRAAAAAVAVAAALGLGGVAAAYAGMLPAAAQRLAHEFIGAPEPGGQPANQPSPGAARAGHPVHGLCTAWAHAKAHGTRKQRAAAFTALAAAAGGAHNVTAYCAAAPTRTPPSHPHPTPAPHGTGRPAGRPSPHGSGRPTGRPSPHGSGRPTGRPSPHGSGKPDRSPAPHATGGPAAHPTSKPAQGS